MLRNTKKHYGSVAKWLHWIVVLLLISQYTLGHIITSSDHSPAWLYFYHQSFGGTILIIVLFRIIWRLSNPRPKQARMPRSQEIAATVVHWLLYIGIVVTAFAGWVMSSFSGHVVPFWGLNVTLPFVPNNPTAGIFSNIHATSAWVLLSLASLHILAALYHQFILRDKAISGMLPQKKRSIFE